MSLLTGIPLSAALLYSRSLVMLARENSGCEKPTAGSRSSRPIASAAGGPTAPWHSGNMNLRMVGIRTTLGSPKSPA